MTDREMLTIVENLLADEHSMYALPNHMKGTSVVVQLARIPGLRVGRLGCVHPQFVHVQDRKALTEFVEYQKRMLDPAAFRAEFDRQLAEMAKAD